MDIEPADQPSGFNLGVTDEELESEIRHLLKEMGDELSEA